MKVLVVTRDFPPHTNGGISTAVGYEVDGLCQAGVEIAVVSFDAFRPVTDASDDDRTIHVEDGRNPIRIGLYSPAAVPAALQAAKSFGPDLIHLHHSTLLDFALEAGGGHIPVIKTIHVMQHQMNWYRGLKSTMTGEAQRRAISECWRVIVMSAAARDMFLAEYPQHDSKLTMIPPGVPDSVTARASSWPRAERIAAYAGRFSDIKGTEPLFAVAMDLVTADPENHVVIAGGLPDGQPSERRYMRKWARGSAGRDVSRVSFPGWLSKDGLFDLFARSSVYLAPSVFETFGLSVAEAMLHRVPVVATRCGGPQEMIEDGVSGLLVPVGDTNAFLDAASILLADPARCAAMGEAARATILSRFDPARHTERLVTVYRETIS